MNADSRSYYCPGVWNSLRDWRSEAFELIETGDILTVDGYQGIIIIEKRALQKKKFPAI